MKNHKFSNGLEMWKEDNKIPKILHQEIRGQVKTIVMEHFKSILFHKYRSANKQHTFNQLIIIYSEFQNL